MPQRQPYVQAEKEPAGKCRENSSQLEEGHRKTRSPLQMSPVLIAGWPQSHRPPPTRGPCSSTATMTPWPTTPRSNYISWEAGPHPLQPRSEPQRTERSTPPGADRVGSTPELTRSQGDTRCSPSQRDQPPPRSPSKTP